MLYYIHTHLASGSAQTTLLCAHLLQAPGKQAFYLMPCSEAHHSNFFFKDFHSQLNASEGISLYQFFFSWYLTIVKSSSFVLKRGAAGSVSTWMSELFKLQEPGLFPLEYLWVLKAKIASSCQSESMHKLFS